MSRKINENFYHACQSSDLDTVTKLLSQGADEIHL